MRSISVEEITLQAASLDTRFAIFIDAFVLFPSSRKLHSAGESIYSCLTFALIHLLPLIIRK